MKRELAYSLDGLLRIVQLGEAVGRVELQLASDPELWTHCAYRRTDLERAWRIFNTQCEFHMTKRKKIDPPKFMAVFTVPAEVDRRSMNLEDGGQSVVLDPVEATYSGDRHREFFVRLYSWADRPSYGKWDWEEHHHFMRDLMGKKVRVTVEVIE